MLTLVACLYFTLNTRYNRAAAGAILLHYRLGLRLEKIIYLKFFY